MVKKKKVDRNENMRRIRAKDTGPEMVVRRLIYGMGYRYRLHYAKLPGKPDIVIPRLKRIIEVRGCFWHQHGGCSVAHTPKTRLEYWGPKLERNCRRDEQNERKLAALGWKVLVLWECEIKKDEHLSLRLTRFLTE